MVKVEVDLLNEFSKRIKIGLKRSNGEIVEKWVKIKYDYMQKYCKTYMIQGHDEEKCYVKHPIQNYTQPGRMRAKRSMRCKGTDKGKERRILK